MVILALVLTSKTYITYNLLERRKIDALPVDTRRELDRITAQSEHHISILLDIEYRATDKYLNLRKYATIFGTGAILDRVGEPKKGYKYDAQSDKLILVDLLEMKIMVVSVASCTPRGVSPGRCGTQSCWID